MTTPARALFRGVRELAPRLRERAGEIETGRRLPLDLLAELKSLGVFRMLLPRSHGGLELDFPLTVEILTELAAADGATGWTVMIGSESPQLLSLLPRASFEEIYASGPDVIIAGAFNPQGSARRVDGGYLAAGRWGFASGCEHADWLFGHCALDTGGQRELRCMLLPAASFTIHDTWQTLGMRGTGSHDIELPETFVPEERSFVLFGGQSSLSGALFQGVLLQASLHIGAVALGIAEGALADLAAFAETKKRRLYTQTSLIDSPLFQQTLGRAEADAAAARAYLTKRAEELWAHARAGEVPLVFGPSVLQTTTWVAETAVRVVDACYRAAGGSALYASAPLQRRLRDIHTLSQHASVQDTVFATAGALRLGRPAAFGL
jgi:alkylation response protein AidB-like acyl-CoA dehydrogenase